MYLLNLETKTIDELKDHLKQSYNIPSQKILKEDIDERFKILKETGIETMHHLQQVLKTKENINQFSEESGLSIEYLTILRREVNSYHPQLRNLKDFKSIDPKLMYKFEKKGIKKANQLYELISNKENRTRFCIEYKVSENQADELARLTDFCRLRYVNPDFAALLINSNYNTIEKIKNANDEEMHQHLNEINEAKKYFRGRIGLNDMKFFVKDARFISSSLQ